MSTDNTNLVPPALGRGYPTYPLLDQLVRVTGQVDGSALYNGLTQQFTPPLGLRDREPCYVFEPNGAILNPGIYDCRLIGSGSNLPLYATTCCVPSS